VCCWPSNTGTMLRKAGSSLNSCAAISKRMKLRELFMPTLATLMGVALLVGLGTWQLQRLSWKQGLMQRAETRAQASPVSLSRAVGLWRETGDVEYLRVQLEGIFGHDGEQHLYGIVGGKPGWRVVTPFETVSGIWVMVDRGFVPLDLKSVETRLGGQIEGVVKLTGLARAPGIPNRFTPDNQPDQNKWYGRDLDAMAAVALEPRERGQLVPFFVEAEAMAIPGGWPKGSTTRLTFSNRHLEYAFTWFALAAVLIVIYVIFVRNQMRRR
jgi:surfeit locus 1 family protein